MRLSYLTLIEVFCCIGTSGSCVWGAMLSETEKQYCCCNFASLVTKTALSHGGNQL